MKRILAAALCLAFATPTLALTNQQQRMKDCNAKATGLKGAERKAFMSKCLKGETAKPGAAAEAAPAAEAKPADAKAAQNAKMKDCNAKAKGMKGDARKAFMKECLSAK